MLRKIGLLGPGLAMLWAGFAMAGNVLLPAVKFNADVGRIDLLRVGHEQFFWAGVAESVICVVFLLAMWSRRNSKVIWLLAAPVLILLVQRYLLYPMLDERTLAQIAGETVGDSPLHAIYAVLEAVKIALLLAIGVVGTLVHAPRETVTASASAPATP